MKSETHLDTIGITGGIGAGKSVVSRILRCNGFWVYDCDWEAKKLMTNDTRVKSALISKLGKNIYFKDGNLNRSRLADIIFNNENARNYVNSIVHAAVRENILIQRKKCKEYFFIESAIIVTGNLENLCNKIWIITSPLDERIKRVIKRDNENIDSIYKRIEAQKSELDRLDKSKTLIIENNNNISLLSVVLKITQKFNNNQSYTLLC